MYNANKPDPSELPSSARLLKSTAIAVVIAAILLITVVVPAEYGIDPTRIGSVFGLTEMGRIKTQLAAEADANEAGPTAEVVTSEPRPATPDEVAPDVISEESVAAASSSEPEEVAAPQWRDEVVFTLAADAAAEYKLVMNEGVAAKFEWFTDGAKANFDTHADRPGTDYHNYEKGSLARQEGSLTAAFDGNHGWYWRNRSGAPLTITLRTRGEYTEMKKVL